MIVTDAKSEIKFECVFFFRESTQRTMANYVDDATHYTAAAIQLPTASREIFFAYYYGRCIIARFQYITQYFHFARVFQNEEIAK